MADGSYYDWGYNQAGQLGNGTTSDNAVPVVALPAAVDQIFQGGSGAKNGQTIAILAGNSLWKWGNGTHGQLGNGAATDATTRSASCFPKGHNGRGGFRRVRLLCHRPFRETLGLGPQRRRSARYRPQRSGSAHPGLHWALAHADFLHCTERRRFPELSVYTPDRVKARS